MASVSDIRLDDRAHMIPATESHNVGDSATGNPTDFTSVSLSENPSRKKKKVPRRILHFSDGILEEYSTDDEPEEEVEIRPAPINPKDLNWIPWMWYKVATAATKALGYADFCGEKLAWAFGITSPKYQAAIDEYYRIKAEEDEERKEREMEEFHVQGHHLSQTEEGIPSVSVLPDSQQTAQKQMLDKY